jgi:hypothetical protein
MTPNLTARTAAAQPGPASPPPAGAGEAGGQEAAAALQQLDDAHRVLRLGHVFLNLPPEAFQVLPVGADTTRFIEVRLSASIAGGMPMQVAAALHMMLPVLQAHTTTSPINTVVMPFTSRLQLASAMPQVFCASHGSPPALGHEHCTPCWLPRPAVAAQVGVLERVLFLCSLGLSMQAAGKAMAVCRDPDTSPSWCGWGGDYEWVRQAQRLLAVVRVALAQQGQARSSDSG